MTTAAQSFMTPDDVRRKIADAKAAEHARVVAGGISGLAHDAKNAAGDALARARDTAGDLADKGAKTAEDAESGIGGFFHKLQRSGSAGGALGILAGIFIGITMLGNGIFGWIAGGLAAAGMGYLFAGWAHNSPWVRDMLGDPPLPNTPATQVASNQSPGQAPTQGTPGEDLSKASVDCSDRFDHAPACHGDILSPPARGGDSGGFRLSIHIGGIGFRSGGGYHDHGNGGYHNHGGGGRGHSWHH